MSSFDNNNFDKGVFNARYKNMEKDKQYQKILEDNPEAIELSDKIFGVLQQ